jgi:hypothetical protein
MFRFKTAYAPALKDIIDVHALADKHGYEIPSTHLAPMVLANIAAAGRDGPGQQLAPVLCANRLET